MNLAKFFAENIEVFPNVPLIRGCLKNSSFPELPETPSPLPEKASGLRSCLKSCSNQGFGLQGRHFEFVTYFVLPTDAAEHAPVRNWPNSGLVCGTHVTPLPNIHVFDAHFFCFANRCSRTCTPPREINQPQLTS